LSRIHLAWLLKTRATLGRQPQVGHHLAHPGRRQVDCDAGCRLSAARGSGCTHAGHPV